MDPLENEDIDLESALENELDSSKTEQSETVKEEAPKEKEVKETAPVDPEFDWEDKDEAGQVVKSKIKFSKLKEGYMKNEDYTRKTQEIAQLKEKYKDMEGFIQGINSHEGLRKLIHGIVVKSGLDEGKVNEEVVNKYLGFLEDKKEEVKEDQDDIEKLLLDLDPEGAQYKTLKKQYEQNKELQKKLAGLEEKISGLDKFKNGLAEKEEKQALDKAQAEASEVLTTTLKEMSDKEKGGFEFVHELESDRWKGTVQMILQNIKWPEKTSMEMFKNAVKKVGKTAYDQIIKEREAYQAAGFKNKPIAPVVAKKKNEINNDDLSEEEKVLLEALNDS